MIEFLASDIVSDDCVTLYIKEANIDHYVFDLMSPNLYIKDINSFHTNNALLKGFKRIYNIHGEYDTLNQTADGSRKSK